METLQKKKKTLPLDTKYELVKAIDQKTKPKSEKKLTRTFWDKRSRVRSGNYSEVEKKSFSTLNVLPDLQID